MTIFSNIHSILCNNQNFIELILKYSVKILPSLCLYICNNTIQLKSNSNYLAAYRFVFSLLQYTLLGRISINHLVPLSSWIFQCINQCIFCLFSISFTVNLLSRGKCKVLIRCIFHISHFQYFINNPAYSFILCSWHYLMVSIWNKRALSNFIFIWNFDQTYFIIILNLIILDARTCSFWKYYD